MLPQITIDGRLVSDPELKFTGAGKAVANMRVAASDSKKDDAGNWQTTEQIFINVTLWEAEAETSVEHFAKGDRVLVSGRIFQREYEKSDGSKGYSLEVKFPTVAKIPSAPRVERQQAPQQQWGQAPAAAQNDPWGGAPDATNPPF
ncbi:single-stranded DNA-binding protein [Nocardioides terrigena]|uniref:single-stranded DNA-binding protein n=1 Tax=Nocardioides terrigena TaxID=424797 RepID=UPI000D31D1C1|nr:single-stranded DNA-binding protein [Nocardioides terrigena]